MTHSTTLKKLLLQILPFVSVFYRFDGYDVIVTLHKIVCFVNMDREFQQAPYKGTIYSIIWPLLY